MTHSLKPLFRTILSILPGALMLLLAMPSRSQDGDCNQDPNVDDDGDGLIEICTLGMLDNMRHNLAGAYYEIQASGGPLNKSGCPGGNVCSGYELTKDLDFTGYTYSQDDAENAKGWMPVGRSGGDGSFKGNFEGNGFEIRNLFIDRPDTDFIGFFGTTSGDRNPGWIRNLGLTGVDVTGRKRVGGLVGHNQHDVTNCYVQGAVNAVPTTGQAIVGGLIGENSGAVRNCFSSGTVTSTRPTLGDAFGSQVGGLVGLNNADSSISQTPGAIESSYSTANVSGGSQNIAGLAGRNNGAISDSFATGMVSSTSRGGGAGLVGPAPVNGDAGTVEDSYWDTTTSGVDTTSLSGGGTGKTTADLKTAIEESGAWSNSDWNFTGSSEYPELKTYREDENGMQIAGAVLCGQTGSPDSCGIQGEIPPEPIDPPGGTLSADGLGNRIEWLPAPSGDALRLDFGERTQYSVSIINLQGKVLLREHYDRGGVHILNLPPSSQQVLLLRVEDGSGTAQAFGIVR